MKIIEKKEKINFTTKIDTDFFTEQSIFFDIETTGFSAKTTMTYLIGAAYKSGDELHLNQYFSEGKEDETNIITAFINLLKNFETIICFNGKGFDIPYLKSRCGTLHIKECFDEYKCLDLYKSVSKVAHLLHLPDKKQKSIENFLGIGRDDLFHGGELIEVYFDYLRTKDEKLEAFLLLHNYEDVLGMTKLLPILSYSQLFSGDTPLHDPETIAATNEKVINAEVINAGAAGGSELILTLKAPYPFPKQISCRGKNCYLTCKNDNVKIAVELYHGELYYFFPNYKDYYYLPEEDTAIHKSVAEFVDKEHRQKAKASNCYTRRTSDYLPQLSCLFEPHFLPEYKSKETYFQLEDSFLTDTARIEGYARHLLTAFYNKTAL